MSFRQRIVLLVVLLSLISIAGQVGCAYTQDRGRDALDIFDIGLTVSAKPGFAAHFDFFNITPVGFSHVDGWWLGIGQRQAGIMELRDRAWGVILWGSVQQRIGEFNPHHPYLMWRSTVREMEERGEPLPTEAQRYNTGLVRMISQDNTPPPLTFTSCRRLFHFGWIGIGFNIRPVEFADFLVGFTTLDITGDDISSQ